MNVVYKSKIDVWLVCLVIILSVISVLPVILFAFSWIAVFLAVVLFAFVTYVFLSTKYVITDDILNIKCGFLINEKVRIMDIVKIVPDKSILSAPAASLDRIGIYVTKQRTPIVISPKDKKQFIEDLKSINPNIISTV